MGYHVRHAVQDGLRTGRHLGTGVVRRALQRLETMRGSDVWSADRG